MLGKLHNQTRLCCCIIFIEAVSRMIATFFSTLNINKIVILFNSSAVFSKSKSQQRIFIPFWKTRFQTEGGGGQQKNGGGVRRAAIRKYWHTLSTPFPAISPLRSKNTAKPACFENANLLPYDFTSHPLENQNALKNRSFWGGFFIAQNFVPTPCECTKLWIY